MLNIQIEGNAGFEPAYLGVNINVGLPHKNLKSKAFRHNAKSKYLVSK